ncbi:MAG: hypothetical protein MUP21_02030 [Dehalococcoidia bacterium]|nr:hypothetical protein [Dehalococcoidia bacterium]
MDNTAGPTNILAFVDAILGTDQLSGATPGTLTVYTFATESASLLNGLIDRPTTSRFRALAAGYYRYHYSGSAYPSANNRGWQHLVRLNGTTTVVGSQSQAISGQSQATRSSSTTSTGIVLLAANDYLELAGDPVDGTTFTTILYTSFMMQLVRLT